MIFHLCSSRMPWSASSVRNSSGPRLDSTTTPWLNTAPRYTCSSSSIYNIWPWQKKEVIHKGFGCFGINCTALCCFKWVLRLKLFWFYFDFVFYIDQSEFSKECLRVLESYWFTSLIYWIFFFMYYIFIVKLLKVHFTI